LGNSLDYKYMIDILLRRIAQAHTYHDISKLEKFTKQLLNIAPISIVDIPSNVPLQRLRNNYHGETFYSESEISFRKDYSNIKEFGRANFPNSSKFYASLRSKYVDEIRLVNVFETNREFRENKTIKKRQIFTCGQWVTNDILKVAIFPFNGNAILYNEEIKFHSQIYDSILRNFNEEERKNNMKILKFISHYYSLKNIQTHFDYMVSAFISEYLFDKYNFDGILYPSVRTNYKTYNIVLQPRSVLSKLRFGNAAMCELFLYGKKAFIDNIADADISPDYNLYWNYLERTTESMLKVLLK